MTKISNKSRAFVIAKIEAAKTLEELRRMWEGDIAPAYKADVFVVDAEEAAKEELKGE